MYITNSRATTKKTKNNKKEVKLISIIIDIIIKTGEKIE